MTTAVALFSSGGKDTLLALEALRAEAALEMVVLVSVVESESDRLMMHRVPLDLLEAQAASLGLELVTIRMPAFPPNALYEARVAEALAGLKERGIGTVAFGDLHLADIRAYREALVASVDMRASFPLWGRAPDSIVAELTGRGYDARIVCIDERRLDARFLGRRLDAELARAFPVEVDIAGERGEFHTFVVDGPAFAFPVPWHLAGYSASAPYRHADLTLDDARAERCSACRAPFTCGVRETKACWCAGEPLVTPDPSRTGCLCPRCLRRAATTARIARDPR